MKIPEYFIKVKTFKQLSPKIARLEFEDDEPLMMHITHIKINGVKCYKFNFNETDCIIINIDNKYYMIELYLIKELKINLGDICGV